MDEISIHSQQPIKYLQQSNLLLMSLATQWLLTSMPGLPPLLVGTSASWLRR
jgi:hypothetical protein